MITDGKKWLCLAVKKLSVLVKGITSKHKGDFYCLNYFHLRSTKDRLKKPEDLCENHIYYYVEMPKEYNEILKYNNGKKSIKVPFIIYADLESLLEKMSTCHNNLEKSSTTKVSKHTASGYSMFTNCLSDTTKSKLDSYRGKNRMKNFCQGLKEHAAKIINYQNKKKKETISLTNEKGKLHHEQKVCYICKKGFSADDDNKKYKVRDYCHYTGKYREAAHVSSNLRYKKPEENSVVFHNGSTYDYEFIIKELAKEFDGPF